MCEHKILFVDDDPNVLMGFQRQLRKQFSLDIAEGAFAGLKAMETTGPYAVIVTDMRMPLMNGIEFLQQVRKQSPETIRVMLTGNSDQQTAIDAVNDGCVFRFLTKPYSTELLSLTLSVALEQYALVTAERELLSKTLTGSINLHGDILSLLNPMAFGRTARIRRLCGDVSARLKMSDTWELSMAATLALIGCVTVPEDVLSRLHRGLPLTMIEQQLYRAHPQVGARLIERIPRLQGVAEIVRRQNEACRINLTNPERRADRRKSAVNVLKAVMDFERMVTEGMANAQALDRLRSQPDNYCPAVVKVLGEILVEDYVVRNLDIVELFEGMVLDENLLSAKGELLLSRGHEISAAVLERLISIAPLKGRVMQPIRVLCPA